ncbi:diguanylate cyclase [Rhodoferax saidenbachensis]|uniref:diguanylate cyclase n=1 Tax=Rhodoferax saidenbachensis TaxID=1484693 RepID=A0ABU1ZNY5_9BURK|nr:diguanylate cyclase [Rhodoferax saidenbachensis]MDR7307264.1 diguanylate cyclase (GGDEF)-like protein [Rhodoferax saidenbachensis]
MRERDAFPQALPGAPPPVASGALVRADTLALLFAQSFYAPLQSLAIGGILCWTLWGRVTPIKLLTWLGVLAAATVMRLALYLLYFRAKPKGQALLAWELPYVVTLMLSLLTWGFGVLWLMPPDDAAGQFAILFILVVVVCGSMAIYSAHRGVTLSAMVVMLAPSTVWLLFQPGHMALGLAVSATTLMLGALRSTKVLSDTMQSQLRLSYELKQANAIADRMARTDELTGIANRRSFMELGEQTTRLCQRQAKSLSALLIDADRFKEINDTHGHSAGDAVLQHLSALLVQQFRAADVCARIGGEEFAVLLADTDAAAATAVAEKLRQAVASTPVPWRGQTLQLTVSVGVATHSGNLDTLLHMADTAMYEAKASGRNRVVCHLDA